MIICYGNKIRQMQHGGTVKSRQKEIETMKQTVKKVILLLSVLGIVLTGCASRYGSLSRQKEDNHAVEAADRAASERIIGCAAQQYDMTLTLDTDRNVIAGYEEILIRNTSGTTLDKIGLRYFAEANAPDSAITSIRNAQSGESFPVSMGKDDTVIFAELGEEGLLPDESITLRVDFSTVIPERDNRFGYHEEAFGKMYLLTFWAPQIAMYENGKWNEAPYFDAGESTYNAMADYTVTLTAPEDYVIAASGKQSTKGNTTTVTAPNVREMAIVACNYMTVDSETVDGVLLNMYRPAFEEYGELYDVMAANAKEAVARFNQQIGRYIYDELDVVPAYIGQGGMEMPGLVIESLPKEGGIVSRCYYGAAITVAHEVAHQWFYCAIGNDQYHEPWLDEAFATYYGSYYYHKTANDALKLADEKEKALDGDGALSYLYNKADNNLFDVIHYDASMEYHYINLPCDRYPSEDYDGIVYQEGASFLDNLQKQMGDSFDAMISEWYEKNKSGIVHGSDFIRTVLEYDSSEPVVEILNRYLSDENIR